jgi:hypothetical protein
LVPGGAFFFNDEYVWRLRNMSAIAVVAKSSRVDTFPLPRYLASSLRCVEEVCSLGVSYDDGKFFGLELSLRRRRQHQSSPKGTVASWSVIVA